MGQFSRKTLDSNDQNQVADQRFSLKQWFARGAQSRGLRKPGCGHCYLRFFNFLLFCTSTWPTHHVDANQEYIT